ncbi:NAD(P)-dependent oxidoreductase [Candidatus Woesearchaeota archaeon]|nr:NAD(P)-dependent oxidoreductase [Candidatus Woesearchaeota archaeon]
MKKILLFGGAGFIGSYIARALVQKNVTPIIFDSFFQYLPTVQPDKNKIKALTQRFKGITEKVVEIRGNAANYGEVRKALEEHRPDAVIHLAGLPLAKASNIYVEEALEGVKATGNIIQAIHDLNLDIRFIYTSSSTVYGDFECDPADENHPKNPRGVYAGVKLAGEYLTCSFCRQFKLPYVIIRPSGVYGPTDINRRVVQIFIENALQGKEIIVNDPTSAIDFTYAEDTAQGFVLAALHPDAENQIFNITYGQGRTLGELAKIIKQHFPKLKMQIGEADPSLPRRGGLDISKAKERIGYKPEYPLEKGVKEYLNYYKKNE